jgi:energy-coupling factor transport system ATP-binding protein
VLELRDVAYRYPGSARPSIAGIDLAIGDGEVVGVVGANDAGKTTLCLVASGLAPASIGGELTGEVVVDGAPMRGRRPHELAGVTGIVFQDPGTQRSGITGTVFEEVALGPINLGWPLAETVAAVRWALGTLGIDDLAERHPAYLSGGQAQLVAIASILAMRPRHLVLDEPAAQLDAEATELLIDALQAVAAAGTSLLIAEHRTDVLAALCTRVVALDAGQVAIDGPAAAVLGDSRLQQLGVPTIDGLRGGERHGGR